MCRLAAAGQGGCCQALVSVDWMLPPAEECPTAPNSHTHLYISAGSPQVVLLPVLAERWGGFAAVLISALVFGIAHLSLGELPPLFVLGLGLGWLRLQSGRLAASVLMHGLWNGLTFANLLLLAG